MTVPKPSRLRIDNLPTVFPNAAGLDIGASEIVAALPLTETSPSSAPSAPSRPICTRVTIGTFGKDVARGLAIRCDWGPQYVADAFRVELPWLGMTHSPSFVGEPECNSVIERFLRTPKEQCVWLHRFDTLDQARAIRVRYTADPPNLGAFARGAPSRNPGLVAPGDDGLRFHDDQRCPPSRPQPCQHDPERRSSSDGRGVGTRMRACLRGTD
jgi:hypothetical protein